MSEEVVLTSSATIPQAKATAEKIRQGMVNYAETMALIERAWKERHWQALGYKTWGAYVAGEFGRERVKLSRDDRQHWVAVLKAGSMSTRAIASVLGASQKTVSRDVNAGESNDSPESPTGKPKPAKTSLDALAQLDAAHKAKAKKLPTPAEVLDAPTPQVEPKTEPTTPELAKVAKAEAHLARIRSEKDHMLDYGYHLQNAEIGLAKARKAAGLVEAKVHTPKIVTVGAHTHMYDRCECGAVLGVKPS